MSEGRNPYATDAPAGPGAQIAPPASQPLPDWHSRLPDDEANPYAQDLRTSPDAGEVSYLEREELNRKAAYYKGTVAGSLHLKMLNDVANGTPNPYLTREKAKAALEGIREDLARYEMIPSFQGPIEGAAAFAGQLAGASQSPESLVTKFPGASWALSKLPGLGLSEVGTRIMDSGLSQGAIQVVTDPIAQAGSLITGIEPQYDFKRTLLAFPMGAIFGGAVQGAGEAARVLRRVPTSPRPSEGPVIEAAPEMRPPTAAVEAPAPEARRVDVLTEAPEADRAAIATQDPSTRVTPGTPAADVARPTEYGPDNPHPQSIAARIDQLEQRARNRTPEETAQLQDLLRQRTEIDRLLPERAAQQDQLSQLDTQIRTLETEIRQVEARKNAAIAPSRSLLARRDELNALRIQRGDLQTLAQATTATESLRARQTLYGPPTPAEIAPLPQAGVQGAAAPGVQGQAAGAARPRYQPTIPPPAPAGAAAVPGGEVLRSLHQQALDLAEALGIPLRQGRLAKANFLAQYDPKQDVIRNRVIADFELTSHEAGHGLERHVGADLTNLMNRFAAELGPLDYYFPRMARVDEGFAEFIRHYLTNPAAAQRLAPAFYAEFRNFMAREQPEFLAKLDSAQAGYQQWLASSPGARIDAIVKRTEPDTLLRRIDRQGFAQTVSLMVSKAYEVLLDENAPAVRAIRSVTREAYRASGVRINLEGTADPEKLIRLFGRATQAGTEDMMEGVRPYHQRTPEGPSLRQALITATGDPGIFGRWDNVKMKDFANYLVLRRAEILWRKYDAGELPNAPLAMTKGDVAQGLVDLEAANPNFRAGSQQVHDYNRQLLRKMYEGGLLEREFYEKLLQEDFYVPMYRDLSEQPLAAGRPTAGTAAGRPPADLIRRQRGSMRDVIDPIQSIETQTYLVNRTLHHNDIIKSLVAMARQAERLGATGVGRILEEIAPHEIVGRGFDLGEAVEAAAKQNNISATDLQVLQGAITNIFGNDPIMGTLFHNQPTRPHGEPIVFYKDGGKLKAVRLISEKEGLGLYERLAELPKPLTDIALRAMEVSSKALRIGVTTNPTYAVANFVRDQLAATILHPGYIPLNPMGIYRELTGDQWSHLYAYAGGINPGSAKIEYSAMVNRDIDALARKGWAVQKVGALGDLFTRGDVAGAGKAVAETIGTSETGTRLNIFKRVFEQKKRQGLSDYDAMIEAAASASDLPDFSRHGSRTMQIRAITTFLNANLQGLDKARRTFFEPLYRAATGNLVTQQDLAALKTAGQAWGLLGVTAALGYAYGLWQSKNEAYLDANHVARATHLLVPGDAFGWPGKLLTIPKPFELAIGFNLGEEGGIKTATDDPRAFEQAMKGILDVIMPPSLLPPGVSIPIELLSNYSLFTGHPIVRPELQRLPAAQQVTTQTSSLAEWLGKQINVSPIKIDYTIGSAFGNWGRDILSASSATDPNAPDVPPENAMFLRRFLKDANNSSQTTETFWQSAAQQNGEYAQAKAGYDLMVQQGHDKEAMEFLAHLPGEQRAYVTLQSAAKEDGRPVFNAEEKRLHPLTRAAEAVTTINGYIKELTDNYQRQIATNEQVTLNSKERREAIDGLRQIQAMEQRNALVILGAPGYEGRKLLSTEDQFAVLRDQVPAVADELATRYATNRIYKTEEIAKAWPEAQKQLLGEGGQAELRALASDVRIEGSAFEGMRPRGAQRRRMIEIPAPPPGMLQP